MWRGAIQFGLVTIPVKLYTATEDKDVRFHMLHKEDGSRIEFKRFCAEEQIEVDNDEIIKGYEYGKGKYVTVDEKDLEQIPLGSGHAVEIMEFVDLPEVDPIYFQKSYYLEPQEGAAKPYALLMGVLEKKGVAGVGGVGGVGAGRGEPCRHLQSLTRPGMIEELLHRGGLNADILTGGTIALG